MSSFWKKLGRGLSTAATGGLSDAWSKNKDLFLGEAPSIDTKSNLTPEQQQLMSLLIGNLIPSLGTPTTDPKTGKVTYTPGMTGVSSYPGEIVPGMTGSNVDLMSTIQQMIKNPQGSANTALIKKYLGKYSGGYNAESFNPAEVTDLFNATVKNPAMEAFNEDILPGIAEKFAGRNAFDSGGTVYEMTKAGRGLESDLAGQLQEMMSTSREGVKSRNLQGTLSTNQTNAGMIQSLLSMLEGGDQATKEQVMKLLGLQGDLGTMEQNIATAKGQEGYNKWATSQPYNNPMLQLIMQSLGLDTVQNIVKPGTEGLLPSLISGGSKIAAAAM